MTTTQNYVQLYGYLGNDPEEINTEKSNFLTFSLATYSGKSTDWHKVIVFNPDNKKVVGFSPEKGDQVRIEGMISYRKREIKDSEGNIITTVKEASIIADRVMGLNKKENK